MTAIRPGPDAPPARYVGRHRLRGGARLHVRVLGQRRGPRQVFDIPEIS
jgi:hypothetical protein